MPTALRSVFLSTALSVASLGCVTSTSATSTSTPPAPPSPGGGHSPTDAHRGHAHGGHGHGAHGGGEGAPAQQHAFKDAAQWAKRFDDPERDAWQRPLEVLRELGLEADMRIADIGAGTGYFAARLAEAVPEGRVWAVDAEPDMMMHLALRAREAGLTQLVPVLGASDDPRLPGAVDRVLIVNTYHHIEARPAYFERLRAKLRPGAQVAIVDFHAGSPMGPPPQFRFSKEQIVSEMAQAGYTLVRAPELLEHQHFLIFASR